MGKHPFGGMTAAGREILLCRVTEVNVVSVAVLLCKDLLGACVSGV